MLVKIRISEYESKKQLLDTLLDHANSVIQDYINSKKAFIEKQLKDRAIYNVPCAVIHGAFNAKYANSQQPAYLYLKNGINAGINALFNNNTINSVKMVDGKKIYTVKSSFEIDCKTALPIFLYRISVIYERRIERAILNQRDYINLISNNALLKYFQSAIRKPTTASIVDKVMEVVQDIAFELWKSGIDFNELTNDYNDNVKLLKNHWYDTIITRFKYNDTFVIKSNGIYKPDKSGNMKCKCRLRSNLFGNLYFNDSIFFSTEKNTTYLCILRYRSLHDALFALANNFIEQERRSFVSKEQIQEFNNSKEDTQYINLLDTISYDEKGYINIEESDEKYRKIIMSTLLKNKVKREKAVPLTNAIWLNKVEKIPQKLACEFGGVSHVTFIKYWKLYKEEIGRAILAYKANGAE